MTKKMIIIGFIGLIAIFLSGCRQPVELTQIKDVLRKELNQEVTIEGTVFHIINFTDSTILVVEDDTGAIGVHPDDESLFMVGDKVRIEGITRGLFGIKTSRNWDIILEANEIDFIEHDDDYNQVEAHALGENWHYENIEALWRTNITRAVFINTYGQHGNLLWFFDPVSFSNIYVYTIDEYGEELAQNLIPGDLVDLSLIIIKIDFEQQRDISHALAFYHKAYQEVEVLTWDSQEQFETIVDFINMQRTRSYRSGDVFDYQDIFEDFDFFEEITFAWSIEEDQEAYIDFETMTFLETEANVDLTLTLEITMGELVYTLEIEILLRP